MLFHPSITPLAVFLSSSLLTVSPARAQLDCSYQDEYDLKGDGSLLLRRVINQEKNVVDVELEYAGDDAWLGLSFSRSNKMVPLPDTNIAIIGEPGNAGGTVQKYELAQYARSSVQPLGNDRQTLTDASVTIENGVTTMKFKKPLVEDDEVPIEAGNTQILWAIGEDNALSTLGHRFDNRGFPVVPFAECLDPNGTAPPPPPPVPAPTDAPTDAPTEPPSTGGRFVELPDGNLQVELEIRDDLGATLTTDATAGTITVDMLYEGIGWIAWAFSKDTSMPDSTAVIAFPTEETGVPTKWDLNGKEANLVVEAPTDRQTLTDATYFQNDTHTGMTFTKQLSEGEEPEVLLSSGDTFFLWAFGSSNAKAYHSARASLTINFEERTIGGIGGGSSAPNKGLWAAHGIMMSIAWAILVPLAVGSSILRSLLPLPDGGWFQTHRALNTVAVLLTIAAFGIAVRNINDEQGSSAKHFQQIRHHKMGLAIFLLAFLQALSGIFRPHLPKPNADDEANRDEEDGNIQEESKAAEPSIIRRIWEYQHKLTGVVTLIVAWYNCSTGIDLFNQRYGGPSQENALWGVVAGLTFTTVILAVYQRFRSS